LINVYVANVVDRLEYKSDSQVVYLEWLS